MKKISIVVLNGLCAVLIISACNSSSGQAVSTPVPSLTPRPTEENKSLPAPVLPGQMAIYNNLQITMKETEITASYLTEFGSTREPPAGKDIIWIHLLFKNISQAEESLPAPEHFSVLDGATEFKPTYGHRKDHADYMALSADMGAGQQVDAWLRFDIPADAELKDLIFVFLPESSQVSLGFSSSDYSWADHPIYLWNCAP